MKRKSLKLADDVFQAFKNNVNTETSNTSDDEKKLIEEIAKKQGFTKREPEIRSQSQYTEQFNVRCKSGLNELANDIQYLCKIKKQVLLEQAILAFLEKEGVDSLLAKYHDIIK